MIAKVTLPVWPGRADMRAVGEAVKSLSDTGFVQVYAPHAEESTRRVYAVGREFFAQPLEWKMRFHRPEAIGERGYSFPKEETSVFCKRSGANGESQQDNKEFFAAGRELSSLVGKRDVREEWKHSFYADNRYPSRAFGAAMTAQYDALGSVVARTLRAVAVEFGLDAGYFDERLADGASMLRLLRNLPCTAAEIAEGVQWACEHFDLSILTALSRALDLDNGTGDPESGLWVKPRRVRSGDKASWVKGIREPGHVLVQVGHLGQAWSRDQLKLRPEQGRELSSALHEVRPPRIPTRRGRLTSAYFGHVWPETEIGGMAAGDYVTKSVGKAGYRAGV